MRRFLCVLCILLALVCVFVACDNNKDPDTEDNTPGGDSDNNQPPHTHAFGEWSVTTVATCGAKGEEKRTCACGASETREIPATGAHTYGNWSISQAATCSAKGEEKRSCACGEIETREVAVDHGAHSYDAENTCVYCLDYKDKGVVFELSADETYSVTDYIGNATEVIIPSKYKGVSVTSVGMGSFQGCTCLVSIKIPDSVTGIGHRAFSGCSSLASITIPNCLKCVYASAFEGCVALVEEENGAYYVNEWFVGCDTSLTSLTSVTLRAGTVGIAGHAFRDCNIINLTVPDSVTAISSWAFSHWRTLRSITVESGNLRYHSAGNCLIETASKTLIAGCKNSVIPIDGSVTSIGSYAFYNCDSLASIEIPASVTSIGDGAFSGCDSLASIEIPASVTSIGDGAFSWCTSLASVTFDDMENSQLTSIGDEAFRECSKLASIEIPASVTSIGSSAFEDCTSLAGVYITDVAAWCNIAFDSSDANPLYYAKNLYLNNTLVTDLVIPAGVTSIGEGAFSWCSSLTSVTFDDMENSQLTSIGGAAFRNCTSLAGVYITDVAAWCNITFGSYDANPLYYAKNLYLNNTLVTDLVIPEGVTSIGSYAFCGYTSLASVTFDDIENSQLTSIGNLAFYYCTSLASIEIPASVTSIGNSAFYSCDSLASVTFENKNGWVATNTQSPYDKVNISATDLANSAKAATCLKDTYKNYDWKRTVE